MALVDLAGQYVESDDVSAVVIPTSAYVGLTDGADLDLKSVILMRFDVAIPCALTPRVAARLLLGEEKRPEPKPQAR